jgi:hypothetical protein
MVLRASSSAPTSRRNRPWKLARRRLKLSFRALTGRSLNPEKWVFVVGCYNSGTTLLANLLEAHPAISGLAREGVELTDALRRPELAGWPRMWSQCEDWVSMRPEEATAERAERIKRQWSHHTEDSGAIIEKSIANMTRLEFLAEHFQPAFFIHIVRNGYAVSEGIMRRSHPEDWGRTEFGETYPPDLCAGQWQRSFERFQESRDKLPNVLELSYESLTERPADALSALSKFLQIEAFDPRLLEQEWSFREINASIQNMNDKSISGLSEEEINAIEASAGPLLEQLGYLKPS